ncbi:2-phosphosulfolactate phosphatase family protein [Clostridium akagii]|uniref:2-phosphosulfolactate phosphatase family protein n=1 Tax=Clostridium akagii TaxID=91623 RepID=UPI00047A1268|nr:2-phosphosulfolactate phosphatase family protein [Clostridium akagii]
MKIDIIISADDIKEDKIQGKSVVVIDVLRATSVIVTAISNGCKKVIPVVDVDAAREIASKDRNMYLLGGERKALKIEGFDFSNSPLEYKASIVNGKTVVMTTTNGTRAIKGSTAAKNIIIGAMINAKAVSARLKELNNDVVIVNAGTYGQFSIDDFICAGYIISLLNEKSSLEFTDIATTALYVYEQNKDITSFIKYASHYNVIKDLGLYEDLKYCCSKDIIDVVPEYIEGIIK